MTLLSFCKPFRECPAHAWLDWQKLSLIRYTGKYQLQVFPEAGHFIQEDQPAKTAQVLVDFYKRNDRSALALPPKVADMQAAAAMKKGAGSPANTGNIK